MDLKPVPVVSGRRFRRVVQGKSERTFSFDTKSHGEVSSTTEFDFAVEITVREVERGRVKGLDARIERASRTTNETVLTPDAWIAPGHPLTEAPIKLVGRTASLTLQGGKIEFGADGPADSDGRNIFQALAGGFLGKEHSELEVPSVHLTQSASTHELTTALRALLASELTWARVAVDSLRVEGEPASVTVESINAHQGRKVAVLRFDLGRDLPVGTFGSALKLSGKLTVTEEGWPLELTAAGGCDQRYQTMAGVDRRWGKVSLRIAWE
ncbi:MAG: hypothetical protein IPK82_35875 [Polyangiaceae bacterium]|nr:hypothetical protein [Polyangiaceae bacterium]